MTLAQKEKIYNNKNTHLSIMFINVFNLLDSSTCSDFTQDFIQELSSSFGDRTEAFSLLLSMSVFIP